MIQSLSLFFAAMLMTGATAYAADTPVPNATGEAALPGKSNAGKRPAENSTDATAGENDTNANATATSPGEENKGKPKIAPQ